MIMNPVMFIPFILVQPVLTIITSLAYYPADPADHQHCALTMPVGLGAFFNTNGSIMAMLLEPVQPGGRHRDLSAARGDLQQGAEPDDAATESEEDIAKALKS